MRVLVDRHQADLLFSLQLLFEDRLGLELYVPVGMEWWGEEYWQFGRFAWGDDRLAQQFLALDAAWIAGEPWEAIECADHFNRCCECGLEDGEDCGAPTCGFRRGRVCGCADGSPWWTSFDQHHPERAIRGVTLEQARAAAGEWAFVMATVQDNQAGFHRLAGELGARYALQVGNTGQQIDWGLDPLALVSSEMAIEGRGVRYHQEFDATGTFGFADPVRGLADPVRVVSFVNCFGSTPCVQRLEQLRGLLPGHEFRVHGIDGADGNLAAASEIAAAMRAAGWAFHCKVQGDGFGHVIHDWAAVGRPLVGQASHYAGRLAEPLWEDGVTCVDLDRRSPEQAAALIAEVSADPERHAGMCRAIRARFDELVDFDREEAEIRELLGL